MKALIDGLLGSPGKPPLILGSSAPADTPSTGRPDPGLLLKAIKTYGISPSRTLYVGEVKDYQRDAKPVLLDYCHPQDLFANSAKFYLPYVNSESALVADWQ